MDLGNVPIIGQPTSVPIEKVMEAMQVLEAELRDYYEELVKIYEHKINEITLMCQMARLDNVATVYVQDIEMILGEDVDDDEVQEETLS